MQKQKIFFPILLALLLCCNTLYGAITLESIGNIQVSNIAKAHDKKLFTRTELQDLSKIPNIKKIILLRALTSAQADLDIVNILTKINDSKIIPGTDLPLMPGIENIIWEAIIITESDSYYIAIGNDKVYISSSRKYAYLQ